MEGTALFQILVEITLLHYTYGDIVSWVQNHVCSIFGETH